MRKTGLSLVIALGLTGCVSAPPAPDPNALTEVIGITFSGKPVGNMLAKYGAPLRQMPLGDETIYSWERSRTMYFQTRPPVFVRCQLDAYVRQDLVVRTIGLSGQNGACRLFE